MRNKLPSFYIDLDRTDWKAMRNNFWSDELYDATLNAHNQEHDIGFAFRGNHTRKVKKKSYECIFSLVTQGIKELHLNAEFYDKSLIRNKLSFDFFSDLGVHAPKSEHITLTINDRFHGVYLQIESVDRFFLKIRNLPLGAIFYAENDNANFSLMSPIRNELKRRLDSGYSCKEGNEEDKEDLRDLVYQINTLESSRFEKVIQDYVNVDRYLRWLAGVVCTQNYDGFIHNYALYKRSDTGLYEMIPWDYDATWGRDIHGDIMEFDYTPITGFNTLTGRIMDTPVFRERYYHLMKDILDREFTEEYQRPRIEAMYESIAPYVEKDPYLQKSLHHFYDEPTVIYNYINGRNRFLRDQLNQLK